MPLAELEQSIYNAKPATFDSLCLRVFRYQYKNCQVYRNYCELLKVDPQNIRELIQIPFLPISAFKSHRVISGSFEPELIFSSSGTTGDKTSRHFVKSAKWYEHSFQEAFLQFYGSIQDYCVLALLPAYLERKDSSLIYMAQHLIDDSLHQSSGFYLYNHEDLNLKLSELNKQKQKTIVLGVSFALLDFAEQFHLNPFPNLIVMETGGMKGRRKEMIREELHETLKSSFQTENIHAEYGMTELLSQAYSKGNGLFECPPWMKVLIRQQDDPFQYATSMETGGINIIDLANIHSCAFIQSDDLGRKNSLGQFEVLGRFDQSDVRGCNLLV